MAEVVAGMRRFLRREPVRRCVTIYQARVAVLVVGGRFEIPCEVGVVVLSSCLEVTPGQSDLSSRSDIAWLVSARWGRWNVMVVKKGMVCDTPIQNQRHGGTPRCPLGQGSPTPGHRALPVCGLLGPGCTAGCER